ncbi:MAG: hypothetical protein O7G85_16500 [Planctomycetota bacterium]|nr:hypothetical protein [Planctomycetota bacterium]
MKIYVEHDAATLKLLGISDDPACDGIIVRHGAPNEILASTNRSNPLGDGWLADVTSPGDTIVSWSGTLAKELFESNPMTWLKTGVETFTAFCDEVASQLEKHGKTICFHPHSRHVLNDPPSCLAFTKDRQGPFGFALAPAELFEPSMIDDVDDHLTRIFETMGAKCSMVILHDIQGPDHGDQEGACEAVPLGQGIMPRSHVLKLIDSWVPDDTPIVLMAGPMEEQLSWLAT